MTLNEPTAPSQPRDLPALAAPPSGTETTKPPAALLAEAAPTSPAPAAVPAQDGAPPAAEEPPVPAEADYVYEPDRHAEDLTGNADFAMRVEQKVPNNQGTVIGVQNNHEIQRLRGTPLTDDWVRGRLRSFASNDETTKALETILEAHRVVVIHASPGTGRYTTALHILTTLRMRSIRQVRRLPDDKIELEGLLDEDTGWILDLRHETQPLPTATGLHLREIADHLRETRSFVVAVIHTDTWASVAVEASDLDHQLKPADGLRVARAHLADQPLTPSEVDQWLSDSGITSHLQHATPAMAVSCAHTIASAVTLNRSTAEPKSFDELVGFVIQSAQNWRSELLKWHREQTDSGHRTYLLAAAVLDGATAQTVYDSHLKLGTALEDTPVPTKGQRGPGIIELTDTINADLGTDDCVRFLRPGYAEAVVDYFWVDRPHHVEAFTHWTAEQAALLSGDLGIRLADRVSQWVIRYTLTKQSLTVLRATATHWAATKNLSGHAVDLLVAAAIDPQTGKLARDKYLQWASAPDQPPPDERGHTPVALKRVLAEAMAQLGPAYPRVAVRRLADLAAHTGNATVTQAVGEALMAMWDQEGFAERIRDTLTAWFTAPQHHQTAAARRAFLHLAERTGPYGIPILLATDNSGPDSWTLTGWRRSLDDASSSQIQGAVNAWLEAALAHRDLRTTIVTTFTEAVFRSDTDRTYLAQRYIVLNHAANGWEPAHAGQQPTERTRLRDEVLIAIREADPTAPTHAGDAPTRS
ncbi:hypothetical protein [Streptomyces sp. C]|uniref:hypothetical protein n=1 Tax=Streptomyces sp. C TaxID=253839 RepID=UPI001F505EBA|nr:hypothetical protein [Streptomyces sp. C]